MFERRTWEKGSTNETPMRHPSIPHFSATKTILIFQIKRIISSEKWLNYVVTFFFESAKNFGRLDDAKQRNKRGWL